MTDDSEAIGGVGQNLDYNVAYTLKDPDHDEIKDGYQLRWVGKSYAKLQENLRPETVIVPDAEHNQKPENKNSKNLFLTGDNLEVLKHLEYAYAGKVDMIYIDPPYNTAKDGFAYNDNFHFTDDELRDTLGLTDEEVKKIRNIYGKASHSAWLTFMYPRLKLARKLLKNDGAIFVSIDDNEQANLLLMMNEIFSSEPLACCVVNRTSEIATDNTVQMHEYMLVFSKYPNSFRVHGDVKKTVSRGTVGNDEQTMPIIEFPAGLRCEGIADGVYKSARKIEGSSENITLHSDFIVKKGRLSEPVRMQARWRSSNDMRKFFTNNCEPTEAKINGTITEIYFQGDRLMPQIVKDVREKISTVYMDNKRGSIDLERLGMGNYFSFPKSVSMISDFIQIGAEDHGVILDFFAGSATTAHAVMKLNKSGQDRRYIVCTLDEEVKPNSPARKAGYKTIDQIARDRIAKAAEQLGDTSGFRHYYFKLPEEQTLEKIEEFDPNMQSLVADDMISPFSEKALVGKGSDDGVATILTTWLIDDGYTFDTKAEELNLAGYTANYAPDIARLYLIDNDGWSKESCKQLLNMLGKNEVAVNAIVIYAYSFDFISLTELKNNLKANIDKNIQIIERY